MEELGLHPDDGQVCFGQLLGMCDQISFPLGELGCSGRVQGRGRHTMLCMGTHSSVCVCAQARQDFLCTSMYPMVL